MLIKRPTSLVVSWVYAFLLTQVSKGRQKNHRIKANAEILALIIF
nr:MAG TPA: hypothetical protein [Caudoviricetes sp.]